jgi:hypothetical protein
MNSKLEEGVGIMQTLNQFMDDDFVIILELSLFAFNIKKEVCGVLDYFLSFQRKYEERKAHNMLLLTIDPQFESLHLVFSFVGCEQDILIVEEYDHNSLQHALLKCYHHLHHVVDCDFEST